MTDLPEPLVGTGMVYDFTKGPLLSSVLPGPATEEVDFSLTSRLRPRSTSVAPLGPSSPRRGCPSVVGSLKSSFPQWEQRV